MLRIDNKRQGPFWWGRAILGTVIWSLSSNTCITYLLRAIPTRRLTITPTRRRATAVAGRRVGGKISNMLDISRRSSVARRFWSPGDWSPSRPINRPYPLGNRWYNRRYNRPSSADCTADCTADRLVGMALYYLTFWPFY